jgi:hypothetical protein
VLIAVADAPAEIVDPHCVRIGGVHGFAIVSPSGSVAGSPALLQLIARLGGRTVDQGFCARTKAENESDAAKRMGKKRTEYLIHGFLVCQKSSWP